ncbi:fatty acid desaturase [Halobacteriovorax sp. HLS]|uniref:fatty acid desaturase family protein n=1 Tax=Halobacteriovorax sp. HLS TaxID=2234000 RepID=UPI000FDC1BF2|nr:fatty acid desaturase [Halobacteriovorax sp. HLS]
MNKFKKNPNYLLSYSIAHCIFFAVICLLLAAFKGFSYEVNFKSYDSLVVLLAIILCGLPSSVLHNCAHRNVGPRFTNDLIGEFLGTLMLYGYRGFTLGHMFHHKYPDNPEFDPHPPRGYSFLRFVISPVKATLIIIERAYFKFFGNNSKTRANISMQKTFFNVSIALKVLFWFLVFGLKYFLIFYLPLYVLNIFVFAHINYATHIENSEGNSEIINLKDGLYYKFVNLVSFGGYYHKNHHLRPQVFNPSKIIESDENYISYVPEIDLKTPKRSKIFELKLVNGLEQLSKKLNLE